MAVLVFFCIKLIINALPIVLYLFLSITWISVRASSKKEKKYFDDINQKSKICGTEKKNTPNIVFTHIFVAATY